MGSVQYWKALQKNAAKFSHVHIKKLYLKDGLLAVYKPYGVPVHSGPKVKFSVCDFFPKLEEEYNLPGGSLELVNRIDKNVAGVLLLSYEKEMAQYIADLQRRRLIEKEYLTIVLGNVTRVHGELRGDVVETKGGERRQQTVSTDVTKSSALTEFQILDNNKRTCMLCSFRTESGYKHQIRVHAARVMNCPILGDHKYHGGEKGPQPLELRMMQLLRMESVKSTTSVKGKFRPWQRALVPLHLFAREVIIPGWSSKKELRITADIPTYFAKTMADCDLLLKRHEIEADMPDVVHPSSRSMRPSFLKSKGVHPKHVQKESSF